MFIKTLDTQRILFRAKPLIQTPQKVNVPCFSDKDTLHLVALSDKAALAKFMQTSSNNEGSIL